MRTISQVLILSLPLLLIGCSHSLHLRNANEFTASAPYISNPTTFGVTSAATHEQEIFVNYVVEELYNLPNCKTLYPYLYDKNRPVDYIIDISVKVIKGCI